MQFKWCAHGHICNKMIKGVFLLLNSCLAFIHAEIYKSNEYLSEDSISNWNHHKPYEQRIQQKNKRKKRVDI